MTGIAINVFGGMKPKISPRLLPTALSQVATACRLASGALSPFRGVTTVNTPSKVGTKVSMYRVPYGGNDYWWHWITDVNVVKSQIASDAYNRYYFTGDGTPKATTDVLGATGGGGTDYPLASFTLGLPVPTTPTIASIVGGGAPTQTRVYVYTLVSTWGEEGPPSLPVSGTGNANATWTVNLPQTAQPGGGTYQVATKNLYRTVTAADGTVSYLFVASVALATASYADAILDAALIGGTVLPSTTWVAPPATLSGLIALPNGSMAGFTGNQLCLSEPYQPHAWPTRNRYSVDFNIVGIAANGSSIAVCTTANPYVFSGSTADGMVPTRGRSPEPCLSKRSVVDVGWGIMYASPNGLVNALADQTQVVTADSILPKDWKATYYPDTMIGAMYQGVYFGFYKRSSGAAGGGIIVGQSNEFGVGGLNNYVTGSWVDPTSGILYLIENGNIVQFDIDPNSNLTADWKSKLFLERKSINYGVVQLDADYAAIGSASQTAGQIADDLAFNSAMLAAQTDHGELGTFWLGEIALGGSLLHGGASLTVNFAQLQIYVGETLKYTKIFTDRHPAKLPSGFKDNRIEVRVAANVDVYSVKIAENTKALQRL